jgi:hypothetical protein
MGKFSLALVQIHYIGVVCPVSFETVLFRIRKRNNKFGQLQYFVILREKPDTEITFLTLWDGTCICPKYTQ